MSVQVAVKPQGLPSEDSPCSKSSDASSQTRGVSAAQVPIAPPTPRINVERVASDTAALLAYHSPGISEAEARELSAHLWMDTHHSLPTRGRALTTPAISPPHDEARTEAGVRLGGVRVALPLVEEEGSSDNLTRKPAGFGSRLGALNWLNKQALSYPSPLPKATPHR
eukprot:27214_1